MGARKKKIQELLFKLERMEPALDGVKLSVSHSNGYGGLTCPNSGETLQSGPPNFRPKRPTQTMPDGCPGLPRKPCSVSSNSRFGPKCKLELEISNSGLKFQVRI